MTVSTAAATATGDIGLVYVLALDAASKTAVAQTRATATDGYAFTIPSLPAGDYQIVAGTDLDNDGIINNEGEAYGAYPTPNAPATVHLATDTTGLDIPIRFQFSVHGAAVGTRGGPAHVWVR